MNNKIGKALIGVVMNVVNDERNQRPLNEWVIGLGSDFNRDTPQGCCVTFEYGNSEATIQAYLHFRAMGMTATPLIVTSDTKYLYLYRVDKGVVRV